MTARALAGAISLSAVFIRSLVDVDHAAGCAGGFVIGEQMDQRALDRGLPRRRVDLGAEQVGDIEHVAGRARPKVATWAEAMLRLSFEIAVVS